MSPPSSKGLLTLGTGPQSPSGGRIRALRARQVLLPEREGQSLSSYLEGLPRAPLSGPEPDEFYDTTRKGYYPKGGHRNDQHEQATCLPVASGALARAR